MTDPSKNIDAVLASFDDRWSPRVVAQVNDWDLRVAKVEGEFVWHAHQDTDELFVLLDGEMEIHIRDGDAVTTVSLERHDVFVVPQGVEHCPESKAGAVILLLEPSGTLSTGDYTGNIPDHITSTTGIPS